MDSGRLVDSPVKKVNYLVEAARLGQTTDYDKLTIDVWTNGLVTARDAVSLAAKLIRDHLNIFINLEDAGDQAQERQAERRGLERSTRTSTRASRSWSSRSAPTTASRTRTSGRSASWCRRPRPRCSRRRTSAASRSTRSRRSCTAWAEPRHAARPAGRRIRTKVGSPQAVDRATDERSGSR